MEKSSRLRRAVQPLSFYLMKRAQTEQPRQKGLNAELRTVATALRGNCDEGCAKGRAAIVLRAVLENGFNTLAMTVIAV